jgi:hypothetical protein
MVLAIRFEGLVWDGVVADYAELARLGHITWGRMTQIGNLLNFAPDIQGSDHGAGVAADRGGRGLEATTADVADVVKECGLLAS